MTFLQLCQAVRAQSGISGEGPSSVTNQLGVYADVVRWVAEAYNEIQTMYENWNFLHNHYQFTLQGGQSHYNPAQLVGSAGGVGVRTPTKDTFIVDKQSAVPVRNKRLDYIPWSVWQIDNRVLDGTIGRPTQYTEDPAGVYHFYPYEAPNSDAQLRIDHTIDFQGYARPHVMVENEDTPILNPQYDELIVMKALIRYAEYYNSPEIMQSVTMRLNEQMKTLKYSELPRENLNTPPLVAFA